MKAVHESNTNRVDHIQSLKVEPVGEETSLNVGQEMRVKDKACVKAVSERTKTTEGTKQAALTEDIQGDAMEGKQNVIETTKQINDTTLTVLTDTRIHVTKISKEVIQTTILTDDPVTTKETIVPGISLTVQPTISQIKVKGRKHFGAKSKADKHICKIVGIGITKDGRAILADLSNNKLKMISNDKIHFLSSVDIPLGPVSVAIIDNKTAVASTQDKKIHVIEIQSIDLRIIRTVKLDYKILGLAACNNNLVVTTVAEPRSAKMIDWTGKEIWSVALDKQGNKLFEAPEYLTSFGTHRDQVIVSDYRRETLTLIAGENGEVLKIIDVEGSGPEGLVVDNSGNLFVTCYDKSEVCAFSPDFTQTAVVLSYPSLFENFIQKFSSIPYSKCSEWPVDVAYNTVTGELYVCHDNPSNLIHVYQLS